MKLIYYALTIPTMKFLLLTIFLSANLTLLNAQETSSTIGGLKWNDFISRNLDNSITAYMDLTQTPGVALAIIYEGKVIKRSFYGMADISANVPVTQASQFWLASVSKHITASLILDLEEEGILSRADYVTDYFPGLPGEWSGIRLEHLMSHTSGIIDDQSGSDSSFYSLLENKAFQFNDTGIEMYLKHVNIRVGAGEKHIYSDTGFIVLALIASKAADTSFGKLMQNHILNPSNMSAYLINPSADSSRQVHGYTSFNWEVQTDKNWESVRQTDRRLYGGAGSLFVTLDDMIRWNEALNENKILDKETANLLWNRFELNSGEKIDYGLGLRVQDYAGGKLHGHEGIAGTEYWKIPNHNLDIIVLTNHSFSLASTGIIRIVGKSLGLLDEIKAEEAPNNKDNAASRFNNVPTGRYKVHEPFPVEMNIEFKEEKGRHVAIVQGLIYELYPQDTNTFACFSEATFFPGTFLPAPPVFVSNEAGVFWVFGPNQLKLTEVVSSPDE